MNLETYFPSEGIKHWLMRTNAMQVFISAVIVLFVISGWWVWCLSRPLASPVPSVSSAMKQKSYSPIGIMESLDAKPGDESDLPDTNPFSGKPVSSQAENTKTNTPSNKPIKTNVPFFSTNKPATADPLRLIYKGIFIRSDGKRLALIENAKSGISSFYQEGHELFGIKIGSIETNKVDVIMSDGSIMPLTIKKTEIIPEGQNAK
jgi:hypothetical protein